MYAQYFLVPKIVYIEHWGYGIDIAVSMTFDCDTKHEASEVKSEFIILKCSRKNVIILDWYAYTVIYLFITLFSKNWF